ncbi:transposase [mine drainage metagenome]|uniref:Transposase n=1 Tax=mine drainage metagenome TaxID=410659 RepID=T1AN96_9ZZZZ
MYDVLDLYEEPYDPKRPVIGLDEKSEQFIEDSRPPIPATPGKIAKQDYEYVRNGTANIFMAVEPKGGKRFQK